jgi:hypothetical protein
VVSDAWESLYRQAEGRIRQLKADLDLARTECEYWRKRTIWLARQETATSIYVFPDGEAIELEDLSLCETCGWTVDDQCTCERPDAEPQPPKENT